MFSNRLNVEHLSENECETLLDVLERDRELRTKERIRLRPEESNRVLGKPPIDHRTRSVVDSLESLSHLSYTLQQSLDHYVTPSTSTNSLSPDDRQLGLHGSYSRRSTDSRGRASNCQHCSQCGDTLSPNAKRRVQCVICSQWICKLCSLWEMKLADYVCQCHSDEPGYEDYLEDESRFSYDSVSRQFVRSVHKEISAVLKEKLSACDTREQIPPLSLDDFRRSMKSFLNVTSEPKPETPTQNSKDQLVQLAPSQTPSAKLDASDFFNSKTRPGENILQKEEMVSFSYNAETPSSSTDAVNKQAELTFDDLKEEEVKRFLVELSMLTDQIKEGLVGDVTDSQTEEMLTTQKAAVAAMIVSLQQSLYLAVDNQSSISKDKLVKHSQVPSIVCSIVKESIGHPLPPEVIADDGEVDCNAVAECILAEVLDEGISHADSVDTPDSVYSSGYDVSYKLPSFDVNRNDLDPDLLSLDGITRATSQEDDAMSELSGPWDSDSVASGMSGNWIFRGKAFDSLSLSGKSSLFNASSTSEESISIMHIPEAMENIRENSFDESELTLTSTSEENFSEDELSLTPRADKQQMMKTERDYLNSSTQKKVFTETGQDGATLRFTTKPKSATVTSGGVAKFTCTVSSDQPYDLFWFKDTDDETDSLEPGEKYEMTSEEDKHTLEIFFTTVADAGQYICIAKDDVSSSHWLFELTVEESEQLEQKAPLFLKELYDIEAAEGDTVKFRCKVRAFPPPRVMWYKDGHRIDPSASYKIEKFGNRDYMLTICNVTADHDAEFTVMAKNGTGEAKSTAQLIVESVDDGDSTSKISTRNHKGDSRVRRRSLYSLAKGSDAKPAVNQGQGKREVVSPVQTKSLTDKSNDCISPLPQKEVGKTTSAAKPMNASAGDSKDSDTGITQLEKGHTPPSPHTNVELSSNGEYSTVSTVPLARMSPGNTNSVEKVTNQNLPTERTPKSSLRSAMKKENYRYPGGGEVENTVKVKPTTAAEISSSPQTSTSGVKAQNSGQQRHASVVELKLDSASPKPPSASKSIDGSCTSPPAMKSQQKNNTQDMHDGVDIQPGFVREKQFQQFGSNITPVKPARRRKKLAPTPPDVVDLSGCSSQDDLPASRAEWSDSMLTVKERRRSFTSDVPVNHKNGADSSSGAKVPSVSLKTDQLAVLVTSIASLPSPAVHSSATPPSPAVPNSATPPSPAVPNSATPPSTSSSSPEGKKKTVTKKVVKRTVSVKRTIIPTFDDDLAGAPPNDGCDYIKVCGKWVKMKSRTQAVAGTKSMTKVDSSNQAKDKIPVTKSEWGENVYVEERMKKFKKEQEAIGKLITGRNWGPVTKV